VILRIILSIALVTLMLSCGSNEPDFCETVDCLNGGECNGVSCDCPPGFDGTDCSNQKDPSTIEILSVILNDFDTLDIEGKEWDENPDQIFPALPDTNLPDVYFSLSNANGIVYSNQANVLNASPGVDTELKILGGELLLEDWDIEHKITLLDLDRNGGVDLMDQLLFTPLDTLVPFPDSLIVTNDTTKFTILLDYKF